MMVVVVRVGFSLPQFAAIATVVGFGPLVQCGVGDATRQTCEHEEGCKAPGRRMSPRAPHHVSNRCGASHQQAVIRPV